MLVAPKVGGVTASDGTWVEAHHMIDGGPSVLFDAVAVLASAAAIEDIINEAAARETAGNRPPSNGKRHYDGVPFSDAYKSPVPLKTPLSGPAEDPAETWLQAAQMGHHHQGG